RVARSSLPRARHKAPPRGRKSARHRNATDARPGSRGPIWRANAAADGTERADGTEKGRRPSQLHTPRHASNEPSRPMADSQKYVYSFGGGKAEGKAGMKDLLGGKGANLAEMSAIGIPVPPGFTITTEVCAAYYQSGRKLPEEVRPQVEAALKRVE